MFFVPRDHAFPSARVCPHKQAQAFEDVVGEPDGIRSDVCVWQNSYTCFTCCFRLCYKLLTLLCGIPLSIFWACQFAGLVFVHIWYISPSLRLFTMNCGCAQRFYDTCLQCCLAPVVQTVGLLFSSIVVTNKQ